MKIIKILFFMVAISLLVFIPSRMVYADNSESVYEGVDYSSIYNKDYYLNKYSDLQTVFGNNPAALIQHFVINGMNEGRQATATFEVNFYKSANSDLSLAFGSDLKSYYLHFMKYGYDEGRKSTSNNLSYTSIYKGTDYSAIYNKDYYLNTYPDLKAAFGNNTTRAIEHFLNNGIYEGRQACSNFNIASYISSQRDLRSAFLTNIKAYYIHYINHGFFEGRKAVGSATVIDFSAIYNGVDYSSIYNKDYYLSHNSDLQRAIGNNPTALIQHFIYNGMYEGRRSSSTFNASAYFNNYSDLRSIYKFNIREYYIHYMNHGQYEKRSAVGNSVWSKVGIDVSSYQGNINWAAVKSDGIGFAIIRIGWGGNYTSQDDTKAIYNMNECERLGIPYGVYLFSEAISLDRVDSEVQHTLRMISGRNPSMGIWYDMESSAWKEHNGITVYSSGDLLTQMCVRFVSSIKANGYSLVGTYSNPNYFSNGLNYSAVSSVGEIWLAHWEVSSPSSSYPCIFWQYSSTGSVSGISGRVDMNKLYR